MAAAVGATGHGGATVGILQTGVPPADLARTHGCYDAMVARMLGGTGFRTYDVQAGDLPADPADHPAYVVTGSSAGVYDPLPWIAPLGDFLRRAHGRARLVGLCFGHQVMAEALGGRVEKSSKGWGLGLHDYAVTARAPWMGEGPDRLRVPASHQDQVTVPPAGATVLAASPFTPFAALAYAGGPSVSFQFHPEFTVDFAAALLELRRPNLPPGVAAEALASFRRPSDARRVAGWIRRFLDRD